MQRTITIMWKEQPQIEIKWDTMKYNSATSVVLADKLSPKVPNNLRVSNPDFKAVLSFLESRCVPRTRIDIQEILRAYGLREYNPMLMCRKSHGRSPTDYIWVKFDDDPPEITWENIRLRYP